MPLGDYCKTMKDCHKKMTYLFLKQSSRLCLQLSAWFCEICFNLNERKYHATLKNDWVFTHA